MSENQWNFFHARINRSSRILSFFFILFSCELKDQSFQKRYVVVVVIGNFRDQGWDLKKSSGFPWFWKSAMLSISVFGGTAATLLMHYVTCSDNSLYRAGLAAGAALLPGRPYCRFGLVSGEALLPVRPCCRWGLAAGAVLLPGWACYRWGLATGEALLPMRPCCRGSSGNRVALLPSSLAAKQPSQLK